MSFFRRLTKNKPSAPISATAKKKPAQAATTTITPPASSVSSNSSIHELISFTDHEGVVDILDYVDIVKPIGEGSTCKVFAVQKKKSPKPAAETSSSVDNNNNEEEESASTHRNPMMKKKNNKLYALKEISKARVDDTFLKEMNNELSILRKLDHANIVKLYGTFESKRSVYMLMDYCSGGDLVHGIPYSEAKAANIMTRLLSALAYMHKQGVTHRDIKLENIMWENDSPDAQIKLIDFGLSKSYVRSPKYRMKCRVGTTYTMAPEVLKGKYKDNADVWSAGVVAFCLLSGDRPFHGNTDKEIAYAILHGEYDKEYQGKEWRQVSSDSKDFVSALMNYEADKRISAATALRHKWLNTEFPLSNRRPDERVMNQVHNALIQSSKDSRFKRVAMMTIAHHADAEQIVELRDAFDQYDANNNGTITYWELRRALKTCNFSDHDLKKIFQDLDVNETGVVNFNEFLAATMEARGQIEEEQIAEAFDKLDVDNSGVITKENICAVLGSHCDSDCEKVVGDIMEEVDTNKDGQISYEEFLDVFRSRHRESVDAACCDISTGLKPNANGGCNSCGTKRSE